MEEINVYINDEWEHHKYPVGKSALSETAKKRLLAPSL